MDDGLKKAQTMHGVFLTQQNALLIKKK